MGIKKGVPTERQLKERESLRLPRDSKDCRGYIGIKSWGKEAYGQEEFRVGIGVRRAERRWDTGYLFGLCNSYFSKELEARMHFGMLIGNIASYFS